MEGASRQSLAAARSVLDQVTAVPIGATAGTVAPEVRRIAGDLSAVATLVGGEPTVRRALTDPGAPPQSRTGLAARLLGGQISQGALAVVSAAVAGRWSRPADLRYALEELAVEATLAEAEAADALDEVEDELFRFGRILGQNPQLSLALTDPAAPTSAKVGLVTRLLSGRAHPVTLRLAEQAVADREQGDIERRLEQLSRIAAARRGRVVAVVRTATVLDADQIARLKAAISRFFGRQIQLQIDLDPAVLGGVAVRVGDEVVDGTVLRRLAAARRGLTR
ncbi:ATP synthase F1, delta subunit [Parafrankia sp. EAN1pec]|uniref:ATP synthase subunit delta n=1 Tax=Parafrankia sp. (strain EAN1pec) TaxID=298653 RepID=ATPD_PARS2|nr:RecName: Full=ATP synthase subunit delta; AltName: Full=ATP synthase F(1) sector subunit delta; AltName: Full=F-type ATPase subunit delta; Short=F-ATPase subunit delta [Frankia sp. EAN1pec]ABW10477.1 ATP synthase F1, delta subunit [Frankia sp. EAN1pec]